MAQGLDNAAEQRFELAEPGGGAFATFRREPGRWVVSHVEASPALRGTGAAGRLMEGLLAKARGEGVKITPLCSYAAAYIRRHERHRDLLA